MRIIRRDECDTVDDTVKLFQELFNNQALIEAKVCQMEKQKTVKKETKKKGFSRPVVVLMLFICSVIALVAFSEPEQLTYDVVSNPVQLERYLRNPLIPYGFSMNAGSADQALTIGSATKGFDLTYYFETAGTITTDYDGDGMIFSDSMDLVFGTDLDFAISYSGTSLSFAPSDDGKYLDIGNASNSANLRWFGDTGTAFVLFDEENLQVQYEDIQHQMMDDTTLSFGDGDDVTLQYDEDGNDELQVTGAVNVETSLKTPFEIVAATNVLTSAESSKLLVLNSATEFQTTLPSVADAPGVTYRFVVGAAPASASYTIITGNSLENKIYGMVLEAETDTGDDGPVAQEEDTITFVDGVAVIGDWVELTSDGVNWYVSGMTAADGGVTLTQAD